MNPQPFHLVDLDQDLPGYREFLSAWAYTGPGLTFVVDPGPTSTIEHLIARLRALGVARLDFVLVTHVHIDHAGGVGSLLRVFPEARVVCHEKGVAHLVDPTRLWQGSLEVLREVARVYGEPSPVPAEAIASIAEAEARGIRVIPTPGHAAHHLSFVLGDVLIAGEAVALRCPLPPPYTNRLFMRPATPPRFFLEEALASIDRLRAIAPEPATILFAHYGALGGTREILDAGRRQLELWVQVVREELGPQRSAGKLGRVPPMLISRVHERLQIEDPLYANFERLAPDVRQRELHYLGQTLEGIVGYLQG
jgi:glyoxylase-like metal-dependent hydrolase (beta-lactamase superfamily II)